MVVLDNAPIHNVEVLRGLVEARGARLLMLPRCDPPGNAIECGFSLFKRFLRDRENLDYIRQDPFAAHEDAMRTWNRDHLIRTYRHIGIPNTPMTSDELAQVLRLVIHRQAQDQEWLQHLLLGELVLFEEDVERRRSEEEEIVILVAFILTLMLMIGSLKRMKK